MAKLRTLTAMKKFHIRIFKNMPYDVVFDTLSTGGCNIQDFFDVANHQRFSTTNYLRCYFNDYLI